MVDEKRHSPWADATQDQWDRVAHAGHDRLFVGCVHCARERDAATSSRPVAPDPESPRSEDRPA